MSQIEKHTIADWRAEMADIEEELQRVSADMRYAYRQLTQPPARSSKSEQISFYMSKGMAASTMLWTAYKAYKRLQQVTGFFSRKRR